MNSSPNQRFRLFGAFLGGVAFLSSPEGKADQILEFRRLDGRFNHPTAPETGRAHAPLIRVAPPAYGDSIDLPRGVPADLGGDGAIEASEQTLLPSARLVSNLVHDQGGRFVPSRRRLNQLFFQFGQFLSHDTSLAEPNPHLATGAGTGLAGNESFPVPVDGGDPVFAFAELAAGRSVSVAAEASITGKREQLNAITAFVDGSQVYGSDEARAAALRSFVGGLLESSPGPDGELLPDNTFGLPNANASRLPAWELFAAGDVRANEQVGLVAMHTLWLREHNRAAREIGARFFVGRDLADPAIDEAIYQLARARVVALLQKVTYYEWLPALVGYRSLPPYRGYDPAVDPQIANEFATAAFRTGHTMLPPAYRLIEADGRAEELSLLDAFFNPAHTRENGIDAFLRGLAAHPQQEIDRFVVDEVRNFLFGPGFGGLDLPALNLQRGRDHGLADFNTVREAYGLPRAEDLLALTGDPAAAAALRRAYGESVAEDLDLWSGGLCEAHLVGTNLGPTFTALFLDQFRRLRDGDRFYFENEAAYPRAFVEEILDTTFADVIRRNTSVRGDQVNDYAFFLPRFHPFQPDLRIGRSAATARQLGRGLHNGNAARQTLRLGLPRRRPATFHLSLANDGVFVNQIVVTASLPRGSRLVCRDRAAGGRNAAAEMRAGLHEPFLDPGAERRYRVRVLPGRSARAGGGSRVHFRCWHYWDGRGRDAVQADLSSR